MNNYVFSASTLAFYALALKDEYINAESWPEDGLEVSDEIYQRYSAQPPEGKMRGSGAKGYPEWIDIPPPSHEELVSIADAEKQSQIDSANAYMNSKQWPGKAAMGRLNDDEKSQYSTWLDYLDELEVVDTSKAPDINWPQEPNKS